MVRPFTTGLAAECATLWDRIADDLHDPQVMWQIGALVLSLACGWLIQRIATRHTLRLTDDNEAVNTVRRFGAHSMRRLLFPLSALIFVIVARSVLSRFYKVYLLDLAIPLLLSMVVIRFVAFALRQTIGGAAWSVGLEKTFAITVWAIVALHLLGWLPDIIKDLDSISLMLGTQRLSLWTVMQGIAMVLLAVIIALWLAGMLERRLAGASHMDPNVRLVLARISRAVLLIVAILIALPMVGINLTTLSMFGGALGVGLGFGLQKIAANYVSGFIILLDRSLRIGSLITIGNERGIVKEITTRYTVLRASNGIESIVPNEILVSSVVQNETLSDNQVSLTLSFQVSYTADVEQAMAILVEVAREQRRVLQKPPPSAYLTSFGENGIQLRLGCWITDPSEGTSDIVSAINMKVWRSFKAAGIGFPFPQREIRITAESSTVPGLTDQPGIAARQEAPGEPPPAHPHSA